MRARRGPKEAVDPFRPLGVLAERERTASGAADWLTVFLAGAECPYSCVFCDLWRHTLDGPTPAGALVAQVVAAGSWPGIELPSGGFDGIKLYNASNFFDPRAVPPADDPALLAALEPFRRVLVECHPRLVGGRALAWADSLARRGATLEVAMGLETIHPRALPRLGKALTLPRFERAAGELLVAGAAVRAFVLVGAPWVPAGEGVEWTVATARAAVAAGAPHVTLIPVRGGNGTLEALAAEGEWTPPTLADLEEALDRCLAEVAPPGSPAVIAADLWDLDRFTTCAACAEPRWTRLGRINDGGAVEPRFDCGTCAAT